MSLQGRETEFQGQTRRKGAGGNGSKLTAGSEGGLLAQSCPTLLDPVDCSPPGSSVHGVLQARILEWVAISFSRGSFRPRDLTRVSHTAGRLNCLSHQGEPEIHEIRAVSDPL